MKALSYAELAIENTFVIEDSPSGVMAAKQAGIFCIAIASTHSEQDLYLADLILSNYSAEALLTSISLIESN